MKNSEILIVDDEPVNLTVLRNLLSSRYTVRACKSGADALRLMESGILPDLVLLDIIMPGLNGFDTLSRMRENPRLGNIPVIFISALDNAVDDERGFRLGAADYLSKPFRPALVLERVRMYLELQSLRKAVENEGKKDSASPLVRTAADAVSSYVLEGLTSRIPLRYGDGSRAVEHIRTYLRIMAEELRTIPRFSGMLDDKTLEAILYASMFHDIGMLTVPDSVLSKRAALSADEFSLIQSHCRAGSKMLADFRDASDMADGASAGDAFFLFSCARDMAEFHHEHWDGSGYPDGLLGEEIPLSACLLAVADSLDALTSPRPYRPAMTFAGATDCIRDGRGSVYCPEIVDAMNNRAAALESAVNAFAKEGGDATDDD